MPKRTPYASSSNDDLGGVPAQKKPRLTDQDRERLLKSVDWMRKEILPNCESQNAKEMFEMIVSHLNGKLNLEDLFDSLSAVETGNEEVEPLVEKKGGADKKQPRRQDNGPPLSAQEFLLLVKDRVTKFEGWLVTVQGGTYAHAVNTEETLQQLIESSDVNLVEEITVIRGTEVRSDCFIFERPFTEKALLGTFLSDNRLKQVTQFLASTVQNVLGDTLSQHGLAIPKLLPGAVETNGKLRDYLLHEPQENKDYAIVVAGESGSGKTVHSCQVPAAEGFCCLYAAIQGDDLKGKPKPDENTKAWTRHLQRIIDYFGAVHPDDTSLRMSGLYNLRTLLNRQRNEWACTVLENVVRKSLRSNSMWWDDGSNYKDDEKPEKLAIIVDEATDMDLANGVIDSIRNIYAKKRSLVGSRLRIILCGTGLDAVDCGGKVGSNSEKSQVVIMKALCPENIGSKILRREVLKAVAEGTVSRVLSTNARMFFRGVYPLMSMTAHEVDEGFDDEEKKRRLESRLQEIGSFGALMDYSVRNYMLSNSVSTFEGKKDLLDACFVYHLTSSLQASPNVSRTQTDDFLQPLLALPPEQEGRFWKLENGVVTTDEEIFSRGLAMRDGSTSTALKYLSCAGLPYRIETDGDGDGDGVAFENLVRLHLTRFYSILGYTVMSRDLSNSWPPPLRLEKGDVDIGEDDIKALADDLSRKSEMCVHSDVILKEIADQEDSISSTEKWCVLCRHGSTTTHASNLFVVRCDNDDETDGVCVDAIQTMQHSNAITVPKASTCWRSLGIDPRNYNGAPTLGSAGYSYQGIVSFIALLKRQGFNKVALGKRVLAVSQVAGERGNLDISGNVTGTALWTREFLEPTFSCLYQTF